MSEIRPGDWVECLNNWFDADFSERVERGAKYRVQQVAEDCDPGCALHGPECMAAGLKLDGMPRAYWCADQFRRVLGVAA